MSWLEKQKKQIQESAWLLGICENSFEDLKENRIHWISNGKYEGKKWFADPFILDYDEKTIHLLVEEFDYKTHRGRIAKLAIDRVRWEVEDCKIILDLPTHLSFPMIWRENGNIYVCPENYKSGGWSIYRYDVVEKKLDYIKKISEEKLTDAIIWQNGNDYYLLSTFEPRPNGPELTIWKSDSLTGRYEEMQRIKFKENLGRNAGMIFRYDNKWIRPAQESNHVYGHSISFQEVSLQNDEFCFEETHRFHTPHPVYDAGTHTYNQYKDMAVIDVKGYRYKKTAKILSFCGSLLVKTGLKKAYIIQ